jgi:hypothetical protein
MIKMKKVNKNMILKSILSIALAFAIVISGVLPTLNLTAYAEGEEGQEAVLGTSFKVQRDLSNRYYNLTDVATSGLVTTGADVIFDVPEVSSLVVTDN